MNKLEFTEKFDALLCLDGKLPSREFFKDFKDIPVFAADGAALKLLDMNIDFEKVIGDLDTIHRNGSIINIPDSKKVYLPEQETNDFEKCLNYLEENFFKKVLILGFHGGELEHSLNNWSVLIKYMLQISLCIYENGRYAIPIYQDFKLATKIGEIIGLIPQPVVLLSTKGLKWNLNEEILLIGLREGARNVAMKKQIEVKIIEGSLLLFLDARIPYAPNI